MEVSASHASRLRCARHHAHRCPALLSDDAFRRQVGAQPTDPQARLFWLRKYAGYHDRLRSETGGTSRSPIPTSLKTEANSTSRVSLILYPLPSVSVTSNCSRSWPSSENHRTSPGLTRSSRQPLRCESSASLSRSAIRTTPLSTMRLHVRQRTQNAIIAAQTADPRSGSSNPAGHSPSPACAASTSLNTASISWIALGRICGAHSPSNSSDTLTPSSVDCRH